MKKRKISKKKVILFILMIVFLSMFIFSLIKIISYLKDNKENKSIQKILIDEYVEIDKEDKEEIKFDVDFKSLKEKNPDTIAYLKVNGTNIDYVVVRGKNNSYYLNHNFNKKVNISGWIFSDYRNKFDETDKNIVIFGHNTKDKSMFGTLKDTLEGDWYKNEDNLKIVLVTEMGTYYYQVFSTYEIIPEDYYINTSFNNDEEFSEFLQKIKSRSIYNYNVELTSEDKILTLSSCKNNGKKRVALHAKLL